MIEAGLPKHSARWLAWGWLLIVLAIAGHNLYLWTGARLRLDTDILAMLPQNERDPLVQGATRQLADAAARRIVVLVGGKDWATAKRAGDAYAAALQAARVSMALRYRVDDDAAATWLG
ncbi:MAG TPA: hypothetical protein VLC08_08450, partial [Chitinolyticbacter sp.]|nr:hypothetical protein [Chitinolyticbacter sp.]